VFEENLFEGFFKVWRPKKRSLGIKKKLSHSMVILNQPMGWGNTDSRSV